MNHECAAPPRDLCPRGPRGGALLVLLCWACVGDKGDGDDTGSGSGEAAVGSFTPITSALLLCEDDSGQVDAVLFAAAASGRNCDGSAATDSPMECGEIASVLTQIDEGCGGRVALSDKADALSAYFDDRAAGLDLSGWTAGEIAFWTYARYCETDDDGNQYPAGTFQDEVAGTVQITSADGSTVAMTVGLSQATLTPDVCWW